MQSTIYALLIGINDYADNSVPNLGGCRNDVLAMERVLQTQFAVPSTQIATLLDSEATYAAVKSAFHQHLVEPISALVSEQARNSITPPAVLFHFSGHGSQAIDETGQEPDGFDETLVCHDSRLPDVYDLKDWELGQMLDELAQYTDNITVILDCCHSGSGTRTGQKVVVSTRSCSPDLRPQPTQRPFATTSSPFELVDPSDQLINQRVTRGLQTQQGHHWRRGRANHVLLAASRDHEKAHEYIPTGQAVDSDTDGRIGGEQMQRHGVLTYYLLPLLRQLNHEELPTYRELYEQLHQHVTNAYAQTPQCEGDWGRLLFGGARPDRTLWLHVLEYKEGLYRINAGLAHGIAEGMRFRVYAPTARTIDNAGESLGILEVIEVGAVDSHAEAIAHGTEIPLQARLAPEGELAVNQRRSLALEITSNLIANAVRERLAQDDLAGLLALLPAGRDADLRLALVGDALEIQDGTGRRLGRAYPLRELNRMRRPLRAGDLEPIAQELQRIVRAQRLDTLQNPDSDLADALVMAIKQLDEDHHGNPTAIALETEDGELPTLQQNTPYVIEIKNRSNEPLYIGLLLRSGAWTVELLYPEVRGAHERLAPGHSLAVGLSHDPSRQIRLGLSGNKPTEEMTFLLIGTVAETDFESLIQQEEQLVENERVRQTGRTPEGRSVTRAFKYGGTATVADEWMVKQVKVLVQNHGDSDTVA